MAFSESTVSESLRAPADIGQHYVECAIEDCTKNCQYYCNPCHRPMCKQCRDEHLVSSNTKNHEVVLYRQRRRPLPVEKCRDHPTKEIDMLCEECQVRLCSKCATQNHRGHLLTDLEAIYSEKLKQCMEMNHKLHKYFLPTTQNMQREIMEDVTQIKTSMENVRKSIKDEAEKMKILVDFVMSENIEEVNKMEESLLEQLQTQDKIYDEYSSYLKDLVQDFHGYLSTESLEIISLTADKFEIQPIPRTTRLVPPVFTAGPYCRDGIANLLGRFNIPTTKAENRKIKPMESESTQLRSLGKQLKEDIHAQKQKPSPSSISIIRVSECSVPSVENVCHVSVGISGRLWVSDWIGNLVETDLLGTLLRNIRTSGRNEGYHAVTKDRNVFFADKDKKVIKRTEQTEQIAEFVTTGDWTPLSIHSVRNNGDILVGMINDGEAQVVRYNTSGKEIQNIQRDNKVGELYRYPHYIAENINGDICTSDFHKQAVVVVDKLGHHRCSYTGQGLPINPYGICTDALGHILVCETFSGTIHFLEQGGRFLHSILTPQQGICSVCVDDENNLYVGKNNTNLMTVYKYQKLSK